MRSSLSLLLFLLIISSCQGQTSHNERIVGGPCEDCDALLDHQLVDWKFKSTDTLPGFHENEPKIKITGTVYEKDGKTPAPNVILYIYHVNRKGIYEPSSDPIGWERRHGQHRAWLKTDEAGKFTFYTFRPAPYPEVSEPEHIHIYVKEPTTIPYYIDSYLFDSDPTLTRAVREEEEKRGGSGIVRLKKENGLWTAHRDIVLGLNVPGYED